MQCIINFNFVKDVQDADEISKSTSRGMWGYFSFTEVILVNDNFHQGAECKLGNKHYIRNYTSLYNIIVHVGCQLIILLPTKSHHNL